MERSLSRQQEDSAAHPALLKSDLMQTVPTSLDPCTPQLKRTSNAVFYVDENIFGSFFIVKAWSKNDDAACAFLRLYLLPRLSGSKRIRFS